MFASLANRLILRAANPTAKPDSIVGSSNGPDFSARRQIVWISLWQDDRYDLAQVVASLPPIHFHAQLKRVRCWAFIGHDEISGLRPRYQLDLFVWSAPELDGCGGHSCYSVHSGRGTTRDTFSSHSAISVHMGGSTIAYIRSMVLRFF